MPVPPSAATVNVETQKTDPNSLLTWYRGLIQLKKTNTALAEGSDTNLDTRNTRVLSWKREAAGAPPVVVAVNFTPDPQTVDLVGPGLPDGSLNTLLKTPGGTDPASLRAIKLGPYGVYIGQLQFVLSH